MMPPFPRTHNRYGSCIKIKFKHKKNMHKYLQDKDLSLAIMNSLGTTFLQKNSLGITNHQIKMSVKSNGKLCHLYSVHIYRQEGVYV